MFSLTNTLQASLQGITFLLIGFVAYTYFNNKQAHGRLFGTGLTLLALSYACWGAATLLWTNPFIEYKTLAYTFQLASILVFVGCAINLTSNKYHKALNYILIAITLALAVFMAVSPFLSGPVFYSIRYYLSFSDSATVNVYAIIMAIALILAAFSVEPKKPDTHFLNSKKIGFIVLAICLAISITSYDDTIRAINGLILLADLVYLCVAHLNISISRK